VAERAIGDGMRHVTIEAGHIVILTHPEEVARILLDAAA
jgi:pimeloyl-ACP methyl ester carboxylesterase